MGREDAQTLVREPAQQYQSHPRRTVSAPASFGHGSSYVDDLTIAESGSEFVGGERSSLVDARHAGLFDGEYGENGEENYVDEFGEDDFDEYLIDIGSRLTRSSNWH